MDTSDRIPGRFTTPRVRPTRRRRAAGDTGAADRLALRPGDERYFELGCLPPEPQHPRAS